MPRRIKGGSKQLPVSIIYSSLPWCLISKSVKNSWVSAWVALMILSSKLSKQLWHVGIQGERNLIVPDAISGNSLDKIIVSFMMKSIFSLVARPETNSESDRWSVIQTLSANNPTLRAIWSADLILQFNSSQPEFPRMSKAPCICTSNESGFFI